MSSKKKKQSVRTYWYWHNEKPMKVDVVVPVKEDIYIEVTMHVGMSKVPVTRKIRLDSLYPSLYSLHKARLKEVRERIAYVKRRIIEENKEVDKLFVKERKILAEIAKS